MSYTNWLRDLAKLPAEAQFCLMDVDEQISSGDHVLKFKITEAKGKDPVEGNKGREEDVCRPRMYFGYGDTDMMSDSGGRLRSSPRSLTASSSSWAACAKHRHERGPSATSA